MFSKRESSSNIWMSFTDLLISGLIVFILISVTSTYENILKGEDLDKLIVKNDSISKMYNDMMGVDSVNNVLRDKIDSLTGKNIDFGFNEGELADIDGVSVTEDGKIRFTNFELFQTSSHRLSSQLKNKLSEIWPVVMNKIDTITSQGHDVWEVRIEGHTDSRPLLSHDIANQGNLGLSQRRSAQTWIFIYNNLMNDYPNNNRDYISKRIVTLGFGDKKLLNNYGELVNEKGGSENMNLSRRIEISLLSRPNSEKKSK